jgi:hypothetical protein
MAPKRWEVDLSASFSRRLGKSPHELGGDDKTSEGDLSCPGIWEMTNGDIAIIGCDVTDAYTSAADRLPEGASVDPGERLVILPRSTVVSAKADIPDA